MARSPNGPAGQGGVSPRGMLERALEPCPLCPHGDCRGSGRDPSAFLSLAVLDVQWTARAAMVAGIDGWGRKRRGHRMRSRAGTVPGREGYRTCSHIKRSIVDPYRQRSDMRAFAEITENTGEKSAGSGLG